MSRASTVAFGALAAALLAAVIGLVIAVHRGPEAVAPGPGSAEAPRPLASGDEPAQAATSGAPVAGPGRGLLRPGMARPAGREALLRGPAGPDEQQAARVARAERDKVLDGLRNSGSGAEPWDHDAATLLDAVGRRAQRGEQAGCFVAGCGGSFVFASASDFESQRAEIEATPEYQAWTGGKRWTVPEAQPDGTVVVALALYRPD